MKDDVSSLSKLGSETEYKYSEPSAEMLEVFDNKYPERDYVATYTFKEFTSLCPKTGQPDFAEIRVEYIPRYKCVETKSLKLYFFAYRNYGSFMESIVNKILSDFVAVSDPLWCKIVGTFAARGGIVIEVEAQHNRERE